MGTKSWAIGLAFLCTILTSMAQAMYKMGADKLVFHFFPIITNLYLISGMLLYLLAAAILIIALKFGELSVIYPVIATGYIWVTFLSISLFGEAMNSYKWAGIIIILIGVSMVGYGGNNK